MRQLVIGAGEVGRALAEVLGCDIRDLEGDPYPVDVLHIAFPYGRGFVGFVKKYRTQYDPDLIVIHSTVPVGTSRMLGAVHSPVTGKHPHLAESIRTFVKFFGGQRAWEAAALFREAGVQTECVPDPETTEAGKLWATLQYGWMIALQKEGYRFFQHVGADPHIAYRHFNEAYNWGYEALGEPYRLPIIEDMPGPIGGHCVIPNAKLTDSPVADFLVRLDNDW